MKFFSKMFGGEKQRDTSQDGLLIQVPPSIPIESPFEAQKRSLIGVVARKMAVQLNVNKLIQDALMYLPFATETFDEKKEDEAGYLLYLAERMVSWIQDDEDVYFRVREMKCSGTYHECFLQVYEDVKHEVHSIFQGYHSRKQAAATEEGETWRVYRDVMYAVTQRKFLLIPKDEVNAYRAYEILCEAPIHERSDIPKARDLARACLVQAGMHQTQLMSVLLVISEAVTNILKHAEEGVLTITMNGSLIYAIIQDKGPGFDLKLLPNATLMAGYSTKKSLGQGFTLMMKMAEQVLLATNNEGSTIIMTFEIKGAGTSDEKSPS